MPAVGVAQDIFAVKSRRGRIVRIVREHYLRDDIAAPLSSSSSGRNNNSKGNSVPSLHDNATHFMVPDVNTLLRFLEVLEVARDWKDIIILQTVLDRFERLATSRALNRLKVIIADPSRRFIVFDNEHHHQTYQPRKSSQTSAERDLHAVSRAAEFIAKMQQQQQQQQQQILQATATSLPIDGGGAPPPPPPIVVIWDPILDKPLEKIERIRGVVYESMGNYMARWQKHSSNIWRAYQEVLSVEAARRERKEKAAKELVRIHMMGGSIVKEEEEQKRININTAAHVGASSRVAAKQDRKTGEYAGHLEPETLELLRKGGEAFVGKLKVSGINPREEAEVVLSQTDRKRLNRYLLTKEERGGRRNFSEQQSISTILVHGFESRNRAIDGDTVYVKLLARQDWSFSKSKLVLIDQGEEEEEEEQKQNVHISALSPSFFSKSSSSSSPSGVVVGIKSRNWRDFICTLQKDEASSSSSSSSSSSTAGSSSARRRRIIAVPMDRRLPRVYLYSSQAAVLENKRLVCRMRSWPKDSKLPFAYYVKSLGLVGHIETETKAICVERDVRHPPFSPFLLQGLPLRPENGYYGDGDDIHDGDDLNNNAPPVPSRVRYRWKVPEAEIKRRRDLRHSLKGCVFSIDPLGCEDVDDALSIRKLANNRWEIGVHIADVSHFVHAGSPLDAEAMARATSVYLVDRRLDMLPKVLSTDLCSLRGGTDR